MTERGLLMVKSADDLHREDEEAAEAEREAERAKESVELSLAAHIRRKWEVMRRNKEPIETRMLDNLRQVSGRYSEEKESQIREQGLPAIFMDLTAVKCRAAKSWIRDVLMPAGDRPWQIKPTKEPNLKPEEEESLQRRVQVDAMEFYQFTGQMPTPEQQQQALKQIQDTLKDQKIKDADSRAERMADVIESQLTEGDWDNQFNDFISDVVDFPAGILKAPVIRRRKRLNWTDEGRADVQEEIVPEVYRVDPFSFYTEPGVVHPDDGDCIEVHEFETGELFSLIGLPGYDEEAIRTAIEEYQHGGTTHWTRETLRHSRERARGQFSGAENQRESIEGLEFWGEVSGEKLQEWGMPQQIVPDPQEQYNIMAILVGRHVICVRMNPDPLGRKPYSKASFENIPGAFWGKGVPDLIKDPQDVCNAAARALVANMGISSGPQVAVNTNSLSPGQDVESMHPWKIWQLDFSKTGGNSRPPIEFFQPQGVTAELMAVFKEFSQMADEYSGIPSYTYGMSQGMQGAGRTASGLSMLMNAASKAIKNVIKHIDAGAIAPVIHRFYVHNMLWHPDESIKGDSQIIARGAMSLVAKEQNQMRLQELLQQTANPIDHQIIGNEGRAAMLRHAMEGVDLGSDEAVPSDEELKRRMQMQQAQQQQQQQQEQPQGQQGEQPREQGPDGAPL